jgi:hypothetical protein
MNLLYVRSLTVFGTLKHLDCFEIIQVLDLEGCRDMGANQLIMICKMYLLKYLSLRRTYIKALPHQIRSLKYLETLDIRETNVQELPTCVGQLERMAHLLCGDKRRGLALAFTLAITGMSKLETLSGIKIQYFKSSVALERLRYLTKLNKLSIYNLRQHNKINPMFLCQNTSLTSLAIDDGFTGFLDRLDDYLYPPFCYTEAPKLSTLKLSGQLSEVPRWIKRMECLEELTLSLTSLSDRSIVLLSSLPMLYFLKFSSAKHVFWKWKHNAWLCRPELFVPCGGFHYLHTLCFSGVGLPLVSFVQGAMPALQRLEMRFKLFDGVYGLDSLARLEEVHLEVSNQTSHVVKEKVRQVICSIKKHPGTPTLTGNAQMVVQ